MTWIRDDAFIRGKIPMTKFDVRVLALAMLDVEPGDVVVDIGAGTGSISVQAAISGAEVYAIERDPEGVELIRRNADKFGVAVHVVHGSAPEALADVPAFQKCFIGGSGGNLRGIVETVDARSHSGVRIVANFITPANMVQLNSLFASLQYTRIETRLIQTAALDKLGLLRGQNPVFVVTGDKL